MTIDEIIETLKNNEYLTNREEDQIAEWLEELKAIKSDGFTDDLLNMGFTKGYNKAIDDLSNTLKENYDYLPQIFTQEAFVRYIDEYAEQLKAGAEE